MPAWRFHFPKVTRRRVQFALIGIVLGLGVPVVMFLLGYLFVSRGKLPFPDFFLNEVRIHGSFYVILTILSSYLLGAVGFYVGAARGWLRTQNEALVRLVERMAVLQDLSRQISSTLDPNGVLTSVVEATTKLLGGDLSELLLLKPGGDRLESQATAGIGAARAGPPTHPMEETLSGAVLRGGKPVLKGEIQGTELREAEWARTEGIHAYIGVPLFSHEEAVGVLHCVSRVPDRFSQADIELMEALSAQAAVALDNARSFDEAKRKSAQIANLNQINRKLTSVLNMGEVLGNIQDASRELVSGVHTDVYLIVQSGAQGGEILKPVNPSSGGDAAEEVAALKVGEGLAGWVARHQEILALPDARGDARWMEMPWSRGKPLGAYIGIPLLAGDHLLGVLDCFTEEVHAWTREEIDLLSSFTDQAATAVRNAWLHDRLAATSAERYQVLAETATDGVILTDAAGKITFFNSSARGAFGYSETEARRMAIGELLTESSCEEYLQFVTRAIESKEPGPLGRTHIMEGLRSGGSTFPLEVALSIAEVEDQVQVTGIYRDITERLEAQQKLEEMLAQIEKSHDDILSVLNQLRLGTAMTDADGGITFLSQVGQDLFRKNPEEVLGKHWETVFPFKEEDKSRIKDMFARPSAKRARIPLNIEARGGRRYWIDVDVKDHPRDPQRKIFFLYDISEVEVLRRLLDEKAKFQDLVGKSRSMNLVYQRIQEVSKVDSTVLIEGETGTGKEMVARAIHDSGHRKDGPFVTLNCAGLTESLLESQLFGHKRGAFTGATEDHRGLFETANRGTIFLDEIGDVPANVQTRLLRVLQEREITRVGESRERKIDVRVLAATQWDLDAEVAKGAFRADLLYRIRVARILLPPLHERREDIPLLVELFIRQCSAATAKPIHDVGVEAMSRFLEYSWPGNVRELQNAVEFAVVRCKGSVIHSEDLPPELLAPSGSQPPMSSAPLPGADLNLEGGGGEDEDQRLRNALEAAKGNRTAAARLLGISRATFYRRLSKLGPDPGK